MPAILVIGGLIVLILAVRKHNSAGSGASSGFTRNGSGGSLPDPQAAPGSMVGSAASRIPMPNQITPFAGTAKLAPNNRLSLLNGANRVAAWQVGRPRKTLRSPPPPHVRTANPAQTSFNAAATNPINASQAFGPGVRGPITTRISSGRKI